MVAPTQFGTVLKEARRKSGITQVVLSARSGVAVGEISRIESRGLRPTKGTASRLAAVLNISAEVIGGDVPDAERG